MSFLKTLAKETFIYGLGSVLPRVLQFFFLPVYLTRVLDRAEYGIHGIMYSFAALLMIVLTYRMETAFFRFGSEEKDRERVFSTGSMSIWLSTLVLVLLAFIFSEQIATILTTASDVRYVRLFALIVGLDALAALPFAKLRLENRPIRFAALKILNVLVNIVMILFFMEFIPNVLGSVTEDGFSLFSYNDAYQLDYVFIANLIASAVIFLMLAPVYRSIKLVFDPVMMKKMLHYAWPLIIVSLAGVINQLLDRWFLKEWLPGMPDQNIIVSGIYNAAVKLAVLMNLFAQAFNYAAEPFFFKNAKNKTAPKIYAQTSLAFTAVGSVVFFGVLFFLEYLQFYLGKNFRDGLEVIPILLMAYLFLGLYYNVSIWYKITDRTKIGALISIVGAIITVVLSYLLIPEIGMTGAPWAIFACFLVMCVLAVAIGQRNFPIPYRLGRMFLCILLALAFYLVTEQLFGDVLWSPWLKLAVKIPIFAIFVLIIFMIVKDPLEESID